MTAQPGVAPPGGDMAALAKGGRTNFVGFLLRLAGGIPFLFIAGRFYGPEALGRFASALVIIEIVAMICTIGEKRGLAQRLSENAEADHPAVVADGLFAALLTGSLAAAALYMVPAPMFPSGVSTPLDLLLVLSIPALAMTEILLAALAYRFDVITTVRARALAEPWARSIMAGVFLFLPWATPSGLNLAYLCAVYAAFLTALVPYLRSYGLPRGWLPSRRRTMKLIGRGLPLAGADTIEWGTRRIDIFILGLFASPVAVGIYYAAQQVASLPQKLKTSFEPILGPVLTRKLKEKDYAAIARQVCQVGFWIVAAQAGVGLALGIPGEALMGLVGASFIGGTGALGLLLAAEVVAATAVVAEAALVYVARFRNLVVSIATILLQAVLTVAGMLAADRLGLTDGWRAALAALSLMVALGLASLVKAVLLSRILGTPVNNWRWPLVWAIAAAVLVGQVVILLPEWMELALGIPAILGVYGAVIWTWGFGPEDRILFRRKIAQEEAQPDVEPVESPAGRS